MHDSVRTGSTLCFAKQSEDVHPFHQKIAGPIPHKVNVKRLISKIHAC